MTQLQPAQIVQFLRRFRFAGGRLLGFRLRHKPGQGTQGEIRLRVGYPDKPDRVSLRLVIEGVEEYRFQRRPGPARTRFTDIRIGYFSGLLYLNLDPFVDDGVPALHEFRASDAFIGGQSISWEIIPARPKPTS